MYPSDAVKCCIDQKNDALLLRVTLGDFLLDCRLALFIKQAVPDQIFLIGPGSRN